MECREFELLMTLRLDGAITKEDDALLEKHLENCSSCSSELALRERFARALREMGGEETEAPPEFCGAVMSRLRSERRVSLMWLPIAWRKTFAAAAAVLFLAGGSAWVAAGLRIAPWGEMASKTQVQTTVVETGNPNNDFVPAPADNSQGGEGAGDTTTEGAGNTGTDDTGSGKDNAALPSENAPSESKTGGNAAPSETVMLSSGLKVTGTILKAAVDDVGEARAKAVALGASAGASTQVFPEQHSGRSIVVVRLAAPSENAPELISGLSGIGKLFDRTDESRDVTALYNETVVQYMDLQSRISSSPDAGERRLMEEQAASYKTQLDAWKAEAGKQIVTLWLESSK